MALSIRKLKTEYGTEYGLYDSGSLIQILPTKAQARSLKDYYSAKRTGKFARKKMNPATRKRPKLGQWVKAARVRLVKRNGATHVEIQREVKNPSIRKWKKVIKKTVPAMRSTAGYEAKRIKRNVKFKNASKKKKR